MAVRGTSTRFIGRTDELAALDRLLSSGDDRLRLALIGGEAGIGKSRLVAEWARRARAAGAMVLIGGAIEVGEAAALPYVPLVEALRPLTAASNANAGGADEVGPIGPDLERLLPDLVASHGARSRSRRAGGLEEFAQVRLFEQTLGLLERLAAKAPTILALEDLQWADRSTRDLLAYLARNAGATGPGLIATYRTDELTPLHPMRALAGQLGRGRRTARLELGPFAPEEHAAQVAELLGADPPPELLRATYARSAGNPFYTEELLVAGDPGARNLPDSLRDALLGRIRDLSPAARDVVRSISVGWSVPHRLLARVSSLDEGELLAALREAVDRAVLVPDAGTGRYGFRHPLIAEAVYADLLPGERSRLHGRFAEALAAEPQLRDASPARAAAELANHWFAAGEMSKALPALIVAAEEAQAVHGQGEALEHLERATLLADRMPNATELLGINRWELDRRRALAAEAVGDFERSLDSWHSALAHAGQEPPATRADLLVRLGETEFLTGRLDRFVASRRAAVELIPAEPPSEDRALVLSKLAIALSLGSQLAEARSLAEEALRVARSMGSRAQEGKALGTLGTVLYLSGASEVAVGYLREGLRINEELGRFGDEAIDRSNLSEALHLAGQPEEALAVVLEGLARARDHGLERTYGETMSAIAVNWLFLLGRWEEGERMGREVLEHAPQGLSADWTAMALAELETCQGRYDEAMAHLDAVLGGDRSSRAPGWYGPHEQRAHLFVELGRPADAVEEVRGGLAALDRLQMAPESGEIRWLAIRGVQAATELAERSRALRDDHGIGVAEALVADLTERMDRHAVAVRVLAGSLDAHATCDLLFMTAETARFRRQPDPELWRRVADGFAAMDHSWDEISTRWREAEALLMAGGSRAEAARALRSAHQGAVKLGAAPTVVQIEELARHGRIDLGSLRSDAARPPAEPAALAVLTPREREVLALLAEGRTNREIASALFISDKTASVHVTNIKGKLQVSSRVEAAAVAIRLGIRVT